MSKHARTLALVVVGVLLGLIWLGTHSSSVTAGAVPRAQPQVALLTYDVPAGTDSGANTGATWTTRPLNTQVYDPGNIVALAGNKFTLKEGTYLIEAQQTIMGAIWTPKQFRGRLRNITDETTEGVSLNVRVHEELNESAMIVSPIPPTLIVLHQQKVFELQYYCETEDLNTWGLGYGPSTGEIERYASVFIQKLQ